MGEAKKRGTFQERQQAAITRQEGERLERLTAQPITPAHRLDVDALARELERKVRR